MGWLDRFPATSGLCAERIGLGAVLLLALSAWLSVAGASAGLILLLLAFVLDRNAWRQFRYDPLFKLWIAFVIYALGRAWWGAVEFPPSQELQWHDAKGFLELWLFLAVAWYLRGERRYVQWVMVLAVVGLILGMVIELPWDRLNALWAQERLRFQVPIVAFGLYSSTVLVGLLVFAPKLWRGNTRLSTSLRLMLWCAVVGLLTQGLISGQSRGAWLAVLVVFPPTLLVKMWPWLRQVKHGYALLAIGCVLMLIGALTYLNSDTIQHRILEEQEAIVAVWDNRLDEAPKGSVYYRVHVQQFGLMKFMERPWFGWGTGATEYLISKSGRESLQMPRGDSWVWMDHFHNTYLELLVRLGIVGLLLLLAAAMLLLQGMWHAYTSGRMLRDEFVFVTAAFGLVLVWSAFDFRVLHPDWRYYWLLLVGVAYTYVLHGRSHNCEVITNHSAHEDGSKQQ